MKSLRVACGWLFLATVSAPAQIPASSSTVSSGPASSDSVALASTERSRLSAEELEQLLAPIALYPDALIALILPAATAPADVVLAARHLRDSGGDRTQIEHRAWDESVKSLTNYPDLLKWMDENLQWTKQVGEAFAEQPVEVMQAIQRLRAQARASGALVDTPQQQVVAEAEVIRIVPVQPDAIYVPYYEPSVVFVREPLAWGRPYLSFGVGLAVGSWLAFECDWRRHTIWVGNRHRPWRGHDWRQPVVPVPIVTTPYARYREVRPWQPPPHGPRHSPPGPPRTVTAPNRAEPQLPAASTGFAPRHPVARPIGAPGQPRRSPPVAAISGPETVPATPVVAPPHSGNPPRNGIPQFRHPPASTPTPPSPSAAAPTTPAPSVRRPPSREYTAPIATSEQPQSSPGNFTPPARRPVAREVVVGAPPAPQPSPPRSAAPERPSHTRHSSSAPSAPTPPPTARQQPAPPPPASTPAPTATPAPTPAPARTEPEPERPSRRNSNIQPN